MNSVYMILFNVNLNNTHVHQTESLQPELVDEQTCSCLTSETNKNTAGHHDCYIHLTHSL